MVNLHAHKYPSEHDKEADFADVEWDSDQQAYAVFKGDNNTIKVGIWCEGGCVSNGHNDLCSHRVILLDKSQPVKPPGLMMAMNMPGKHTQTWLQRVKHIRSHSVMSQSIALLTS